MNSRPGPQPRAIHADGSVALDAGAALVDRLRQHLQQTSALPVEVIETHISWLLLAGATAYKIKKPIVLPFLDFTNLEARRHFCEEELRLNRRLSRSLYLGISRITGTPTRPVIDGDGPAIEYAVRMRRFPAGSLLSDHAGAGTLQEADIDKLAELLAAFHAGAPRAEPGSAFGRAEHRASLAIDALDAVARLAPDPSGRLAALGDWLRREADTLAPLWRARQDGGLVREGHGDLHLANLLLLDDEVTAFDGIEFDPALRWIDIVDDAAFAAMDLHAHGRHDLALRFINAWLDATGDHDGLPLWRFSMVYRALVRGHVGLIRARQGAAPAQPTAQTYLDLAQRLANEPPAARLLITHGLPGSGKSFVALQLAMHSGAIRLRSDVERKRLFGLVALDDSRALAPGADLYAADATRRTYDRLAALARVALQAGWPTIVDAAFLRAGERARFAGLAGAMKLPFSILDCQAPMALLRERVAARRARGDDASEADEAVLERLAAVHEPLLDSERLCTIVADGGQAVNTEALAGAWRLCADVPGGGPARAAQP